MAIIAYDFGGTAIKVGVFVEDQLVERTKFATPKVQHECLELLIEQLRNFSKNYPITGIALSVPGAANQATGIVGGASAIPYLHNFNWYEFFQQELSVPVTMANDANCAALGEVHYGAAKGYDDVIFVVIGTGIGGAIVKNGQVHVGKNLHGGEFGYMIQNPNTLQIWSEQASTYALIQRVCALTGEIYTGEEIFTKINHNEIIAAEVVQWYQDLAIGIYNLQYSFDPECIVIAGGVSEHPTFSQEINEAMEHVLQSVGIAQIKPNIQVAMNGNHSNLYGAYVHHQHMTY
ncbi:MAG: ROK family protein [Culicoidibacterales bacterium]